MGFEVDFLAVGEGERSGDAIVLRFGNLRGGRQDQRVVVIDGGTQESGEKLVGHIREYFRTDIVDAVISTHPDCDHSSGLTVVLESMTVGCLLMHRPWARAEDVEKMFFRSVVTDTLLSEDLRKSLQAVRNLEAIASRRGVKIVEPFAGVNGYGGALQILGPTEDYYRSLLPGFRGAPSVLGKAFGFAVEAARELARKVRETLDPATETLDDTGETSAENNSCAIVLISCDDHRLLFTGDAGIPALTRAADYAGFHGVDLSSLRFLHVPHHGSRRNVGPTILNRIRAKTAFISAARESEPKHPSKRVVNALIRRGATVYATQGTAKHHFHDAPDRGWSNAEPLPFYDHVEL